MTIYTPDNAPVSPNEPQIVIAPYISDGEVYHYDIVFVRDGMEVGRVVRQYRYDHAVLAAEYEQSFRHVPIVYLPKGY